MAKQNLNKIFLSAGIPYYAKDRDDKYFNTADIIAIRDSVRALATVVIPNAQLVWGGQPAITPLIRFVMEKMNSDLKEHITLYQSNFFRFSFPEDNFYFENIQITEEGRDILESLEKMRLEMFRNNEFSAGIFIGGMDGVEKEYNFFREIHPDALILPVASTGAAARIIYDSIDLKPSERLVNDYAYMAMFRDLLSDFI
jgi:hypothetical protein